MPEKVLYTAQAISTGDGRNGHVTSADGRIDLDLAPPPEMGGSGNGANPEDLVVTLEIYLPNASPEQAREAADAAHQVCPYSRATRGNISVELRLTGPAATTEQPS